MEKQWLYKDSDVVQAAMRFLLASIILLISAMPFAHGDIIGPPYCCQKYNATTLDSECCLQSQDPEACNACTNDTVENAQSLQQQTNILALITTGIFAIFILSSLAFLSTAILPAGKSKTKILKWTPKIMLTSSLLSLAAYFILALISVI